MTICVQCKKEMVCSKTGYGARWGNAHVYPGDLFECIECGNQVIVTNTAPTYDKEHVIQTLQMDDDEV